MSEMTRRADMFRCLLEDVRQVRAASTVLVETSDRAHTDWRDLKTSRRQCDRLGAVLQENRLLMGQDLTSKVSDLLKSLEVAYSEIVLGALLGPGDATGAGAISRARRAIEQDSAVLESSIRRHMAVVMAGSAS